MLLLALWGILVTVFVEIVQLLAFEGGLAREGVPIGTSGSSRCHVLIFVSTVGIGDGGGVVVRGRRAALRRGRR